MTTPLTPKFVSMPVPELLTLIICVFVRAMKSHDSGSDVLGLIILTSKTRLELVGAISWILSFQDMAKSKSNDPVHDGSHLGGVGHLFRWW